MFHISAKEKRYVLTNSDEKISAKEAKIKYADYFMLGDFIEDERMCIIRVLSPKTSEGLIDYQEEFGFDVMKDGIILAGNNVSDDSGGIPW